MYAISYKNISIFGHNCLVQNFRVPRKERCNSVLFLISDDIMALKQDVWVVAPAIVYSGQVMTVCSKLINNNKLSFLLCEVSLLLECVECPLFSSVLDGVPVLDVAHVGDARPVLVGIVHGGAPLLVGGEHGAEVSVPPRPPPLEEGVQPAHQDHEGGRQRHQPAHL